MITKNGKKILFSDIQSFNNPFKYFYVKDVLSDKFVENLLTWFEETTNFIPHSSENYFKNSAFHISSTNIPENLKEYLNYENMYLIKNKVEQIFKTKFKNKFIVSVHRYLPGEGTSIHNDILAIDDRDEYFFTHRFIIYINRRWNEEDGGVLGIFGSNNPQDLVNIIKPINNTGVGIAFTNNAWHAVSEVSNGIRYGLHFNFVSENNKYEDE